MLVSSSIRRILGVVCAMFGEWKDDAEPGAAPDLGLVLDDAAVLLDDARRQREAEARALLAGGEERVEQALAHLGRHARARVDHVEHDGGPGVAMERPPREPRHQ